jgi:transposase
MEHYAGIDVSLESASLCVVDANGRIVREAKVASEPEVLIGWFAGLGLAVARIGLEAGPLSQWLYAGMRDAGLAVELLETRHVRDAFKAMPVKTDRKDARGIAQLMRLGWFRPVHCKSLPAQEVRALLTARKLLQTKNHDVEMSLRGVLRGFGLKVGPTTPRTFASRIRELVVGHATLSTVGEALLAARGTLFEQWQKLEKRLRFLAREDGRVRRLMTAPGVGPIRRVNLCLGNRRSRPLQILQGSGSAFWADPEKVSVGRDRCHRPHFQDRRRRRAHRTLRGRQRHSDPAGERLDPEELGDATGGSCRHARGQGRARPQARRGAAPHAGRRHRIPR